MKLFTKAQREKLLANGTPWGQSQARRAFFQSHEDIVGAGAPNARVALSGGESGRGVRLWRKLDATQGNEPLSRKRLKSCQSMTALKKTR